jgi:putative membrane protein
MKRILVMASVCLLSTGAFAVDDEKSKADMSPEQHFVTEATQASLAEVEMGKLAQRRSKDPNVQKFGAQMVKDHQKAHAELTALAKSKNLEPSTQLDGDHSTIMHRLGTKPDSEFDNEYGKQMIEAHEKAVTLFSDAAALQDKDLKAYAKKTLPTIKSHQQLASTLPGKLPPRADATSPGEPASRIAAPTPPEDPDTRLQ